MIYKTLKIKIFPYSLLATCYLLLLQLAILYLITPSYLTPPSTNRRKQGQGTGYIECKPIKRGGKEYKQYWYHYEVWREGDRLTKKSRYIPKRLLARVEKLEASKAPIVDILKVLGKVQDQ